MVQQTVILQNTKTPNNSVAQTQFKSSLKNPRESYTGDCYFKITQGQDAWLKQGKCSSLHGECNCLNLGLGDSQMTRIRTFDVSVLLSELEFS